jgi:hypothetical protein
MISAAETWSEENDPEGVAFEYEVLESTASAAARSCTCPHRGAGTRSMTDGPHRPTLSRNYVLALQHFFCSAQRNRVFDSTTSTKRG